MESENSTKSINYLKLLEELKFTENEEKETPCVLERLSYNVTQLKKHIPTPFSKICQDNAKCLKVEIDYTDWSTTDVSINYSVYLQHILLQIVENIDFESEKKEDLISACHLSLIIKAIQDLATYDLGCYISRIFTKKGSLEKSPAENFNITERVNLTTCTLEFFEKVLHIKLIHIANAMEKVLHDCMATIFSLYALDEFKLKDNFLQKKLNNIWLVNKFDYFRNLLLFKSNNDLPLHLKRKLQQELQQKLASKDGFVTFVSVLQAAAQKSPHTHNQQQNAEVIANIVAFPGNSQRYQTVMIKQIFSFLNLCLNHDAMLENMSSGLLSLRRLYDLSEVNREFIAELVYAPLEKLSAPTDVLSGLIVMEHREFCQQIALLYQLFYASIVECLPSEMLINFLPLLLELYYNLPDQLAPKKQLAVIVARCLNNRENDKLQEIIEKLYTRNFDKNWKTLHERVLILPNTTLKDEISIKIASSDYKADFSISLSLPMLLMQANHAILTYQVFMALLTLMSSKLLDDKQSELDVNLLDSEEELLALLNAKYPVKIEIVLSLNTLVSYQPLKAQLAENGREFLKLLRHLIERRIAMTVRSQHSEATDQVLLIMLTLVQEFLACNHMTEDQQNFVQALKRLRELNPNMLVHQRIDTLITLLNGDMKANAALNDTYFKHARSLMETYEPHLQVYGIQMLLDLLNKRDEITLANGHVVVALALTTLKHKESYTFLNCVRLFVALVSHMEAEVLEILSDEYLNEQSNLDFRLVVGEAILKVCQELGPLCYKHKNIFLNMFMHGARSPIDEFRMSSFANLAQLCRILCYQVLKFFQELLQLIDCELSTGKYLPAKRAALLVLSELLEGIDNLMDFEDILLPVYRLLKLIAQNENCDEKMRTHATNGLKALAEKCKKFLFPAELMQKEIRIIGIKEDGQTRDKRSRHILEII